MRETIGHETIKNIMREFYPGMIVYSDLDTAGNRKVELVHLYGGRVEFIIRPDMGNVELARLLTSMASIAVRRGLDKIPNYGT